MDLKPEHTSWITAHHLSPEEVITQALSEYILKIEHQEMLVQERKEAIQNAGLICPFCNSNDLAINLDVNSNSAVECRYCRAFYWEGNEPSHWVSGNYHGICYKCGKQIWGDYGHNNKGIYHERCELDSGGNTRESIK